MGIYTGHNPSSQDDIDKEPFVSQAQYESIANELDEMFAMVETMSNQVSLLCKAVDEAMVTIAALCDEGPGRLFLNYPAGGQRHEN